MAKQSAGILAYRVKSKAAEVLLVHPGGPFWAKKDAGAWSIPKGEFTDSEDKFEAAKREFSEETGWEAPSGDYKKLATVKLSSGKVVHAWAVEADYDPITLSSNSFELEWPPKSGDMQQFPEADRAGWFSLAKSLGKLNKGQQPLIHQLSELLKIEVTTEVGEREIETTPEQGKLF